MSNRAWRQCRVAGWLLGASLLSVAGLAGGCSKPKPAGEAQQAPKYEVADDDSADAQPDAPPPLTPDLAPAAARPPLADSPAPAAPAAVAPAPAADSAGGEVPQTNPLPQPPALAGEQLDTLAIPDGSPQELMQFIQQLGNRLVAIQTQIQQGGATPAAMRPALEAMLEAANRVLAAEVDEATRKQAVESKAGALLMLSQVAPDPSWGTQIREFATSVAADPSPAIAIEGRTILLGILVGEITHGRSQDVDALIAQVKTLLADDQRNASVLAVTQQAFMALRRVGREEEAREVFGLIANAFHDHADPQLATEADNMLEQIALMDLQIETKLNDVLLKRDGASAAFTDAVTQALQRPNPGAVALERIGSCLPQLEQSGNYELAAKVCELIQAAYKNSTSPQVREFAIQKTDITMRRLNLLGKPLALAGTQLDGAPLDAAPYQGQVLLVAFWASAAPSCKRDLLTVKTLYDKYHAQGFDVLGVCLDQDTATANAFVSENQLPWVNIANSKLAEQCGVEMIPYLLLIDRQGNVVDLFVAGSALDAKLADMLGSAPGAAPAQDPGAAPAQDPGATPAQDPGAAGTP